MSALRRAFLAAVPPDDVLDVIEELVAPTPRSKYRWTRRDQWHVTIQYFGKVTDSDSLVGSLAGELASVPAALVQLRGAGGFPSVRQAAVYWLGVADPEPLRTIHAAVMAGAGGFVRTRDQVMYKPHLTLARLTSKRNLRAAVDALASVSIGRAWMVEELVLMESEPRKEGTVYHPIARLPLG